MLKVLKGKVDKIDFFSKFNWSDILKKKNLII